MALTEGRATDRILCHGITESSDAADYDLLGEHGVIVADAVQRQAGIGRADDDFAVTEALVVVDGRDAEVRP